MAGQLNADPYNVHQSDKVSAVDHDESQGNPTDGSPAVNTAQHRATPSAAEVQFTVDGPIGTQNTNDRFVDSISRHSKSEKELRTMKSDDVIGEDEERLARDAVSVIVSVIVLMDSLRLLLCNFQVFEFCLASSAINSDV